MTALPVSGHIAEKRRDGDFEQGGTTQARRDALSLWDGCYRLIRSGLAVRRFGHLVSSGTGIRQGRKVVMNTDAFTQKYQAGTSSIAAKSL